MLAVGIIGGGAASVVLLDRLLQLFEKKSLDDRNVEIYIWEKSNVIGNEHDYIVNFIILPSSTNPYFYLSYGL